MFTQDEVLTQALARTSLAHHVAKLPVLSKPARPKVGRLHFHQDPEGRPRQPLAPRWRVRCLRKQQGLR